MISELDVPEATDTPEELADWFELSAVGASNGSSSFQDLTKEIHLSGATDALAEEVLGEDIDISAEVDQRGVLREYVVGDTFDEIEKRLESCNEDSCTYPYKIVEDCIQVVGDADKTTYAFLLLLSNFQRDAGPEDLDAERLFEEICEVAAKSYFGGSKSEVEAFQFGFPRRTEPKSFAKALNKLCKAMGEGGGSRKSPTLKDQKDAKLDLAVWRAFPDGKEGKSIGFGQCATGKNWKEKLSELRADDFCELWMRERPSVLPIRMFFVPLRIKRDSWRDVTVRGGVFFDRCRIAYHATVLPAELKKKCTKWTQYVLEELSIEA